jgi:hypothetical protein
LGQLLLWLIGYILVVWMLEIAFPLRKNQAVFRKRLWLDLFYMFFNFFLLNLILSSRYLMYRNSWSMIFYPLSPLASIQLFPYLNYQNQSLYCCFSYAILFSGTFIDRYIWFLLWNIHKTHHSVKEMGFAAHFRYNWWNP